MTEGSIWKRIVAFAIPLFWGNLFQQLYNTADSLIVGNFLGSSALAAVSSSGNLIFLMVGLFNGIAIGSGVIVAKYYGARDIANLQKSIHTTVGFGLICGVILTIVGIIAAPQILVLMGTPEAVLPNSITYFRIYFTGSLAFVMYNFFVGILQSVGDSTHPLIYLIVSSVTNIILDLVLIAGLGFGVGAAAFATVISQFLSAILCMVQLLRSPEEFRLHLNRINLDFLRVWLKDKDYVALAYMTGILPIKKYGSHSALNMFTEYSMTDPGDLAEYFGFTEQETSELCEKYEMNFDEAKKWYDGYHLMVHRQMGNEICSIYNPKSVVEAMMRHKFGTYWNQTETYEALKIYIQMDMDGLKDSVIRMLAGEGVPVNVGTFSNDMTTFATKDDVLTLLGHLGYLAYDSVNETVRIPNKEVSQEYVNAISTMNWYGVAESVEDSRKLLESLWALDEE